jgi:two-component system NtrC family sensor kinase
MRNPEPTANPGLRRATISEDPPEAQPPRPLTENEQLSELLARRTQELELAHRLLRLNRLTAVDQLAAGLAHEINNPLGTIMAFTQILIREGRLAGEDLEALRYIEQGALRCKRVIEAVVHHASQSTAPSTREPLPLNEVARATLALMRPQIDASGSVVQASLEQPSPEVIGTFQHLQRLTQILLTNALDATRGGGRRGDITLSIFARGEQACLSVRDNGRGIAPSLRERIFEPFFTTKLEGEAAGLGLATADRIAQSHGGTIELDSEPDLGSTFTLVLPILRAGEAEANENGRSAEQ